MIRKNPRGDLPVVHDSAFIDPTAILCGRVVVHENVFVGPYAVIRADEVDANGHMEAIVNGAHSNHNETLTLRDAMVRLETEALRSTCSPLSLPPIEGRSEDKGQLAEAAAG